VFADDEILEHTKVMRNHKVKKRENLKVFSLKQGKDVRNAKTAEHFEEKIFFALWLSRKGGTAPMKGTKKRVQHETITTKNPLEKGRGGGKKENWVHGNQRTAKRRNMKQK